MLAECCWMAGKRIFSQLPGVTVDVMMKRYGLLRFCSLTAWAIAAIPSRRWWLSKLPSGRLGVGATKMQAFVHKTAYCIGSCFQRWSCFLEGCLEPRLLDGSAFRIDIMNFFWIEIVSFYLQTDLRKRYRQWQAQAS